MCIDPPPPPLPPHAGRARARTRTRTRRRRYAHAHAHAQTRTRRRAPCRGETRARTPHPLSQLRRVAAAAANVNERAADEAVEADGGEQHGLGRVAHGRDGARRRRQPHECQRRAEQRCGGDEAGSGGFPPGATRAGPQWARRERSRRSLALLREGPDRMGTRAACGSRGRAVERLDVRVERSGPRGFRGDSPRRRPRRASAGAAGTQQAPPPPPPQPPPLS